MNAANGPDSNGSSADKIRSLSEGARTGENDFEGNSLPGSEFRLLADSIKKHEVYFCWGRQMPIHIIQ
jgi:hypothetical protein